MYVCKWGETEQEAILKPQTSFLSAHNSKKTKTKKQEKSNQKKDVREDTETPHYVHRRKNRLPFSNYSIFVCVPLSSPHGSVQHSLLMYKCVYVWVCIYLTVLQIIARHQSDPAGPGHNLCLPPPVILHARDGEDVALGERQLFGDGSLVHVHCSCCEKS